MKRLYTIFCILLYSISAIGATITTHYCAGKIRACQCAKPNQKMGIKKDTCCAEKTTFHKKQDQHAVQAGQSKLTKQLFVSAHTALGIFTIPNTLILLGKKPIYTKFGIIFSGPPIYKLVCTYLI